MIIGRDGPRGRGPYNGPWGGGGGEGAFISRERNSCRIFLEVKNQESGIF